jgi:hypothetical protein
VGNTVLFRINTWNMNWREGKMEEKRNAAAISSVLVDEVDDGEVR